MVSEESRKIRLLRASELNPQAGGGNAFGVLGAVALVAVEEPFDPVELVLDGEVRRVRGVDLPGKNAQVRPLVDRAPGRVGQRPSDAVASRKTPAPAGGTDLVHVNRRV